MTDHSNAPWAINWLDQEKVEDLRGEIKKAEKKTRGELMLVIARSSLPFDFVFWKLNWFVSAVALSIVFFASHIYWPWIADQILYLGATFLFTLFSAFFFSQVLVRSEFLRRCLTSQPERRRFAEQRAQLEFIRLGGSKTVGGTGILIFISLADHCVVVLGDHGINSKMTETTWSEVVAFIIDGVKQKNLYAGLKKAISACGSLLEKYFPAGAENPNELPNHLLFID